MKQLSLARHLQFFQVLLNFYLRKEGSCHQQISKIIRTRKGTDVNYIAGAVPSAVMLDCLFVIMATATN